MTTHTIEAVFEHGSFRIVTPVELPIEEGQKVRLQIELVGDPDDILELAAQVYAGLTPTEIADLDQHLQRRPDFFSGGRTP